MTGRTWNLALLVVFVIVLVLNLHDDNAFWSAWTAFFLAMLVRDIWEARGRHVRR